MMKRLPSLTKKNLEKYLKSLKPTSVCGRPGEGDSCPIARFLKKEHGTQDVNVDHHSVGIGDQGFVTPKWAQKFIYKVDELDRNTIKAKEALKILRAA